MIKSQRTFLKRINRQLKAMLVDAARTHDHGSAEVAKFNGSYTTSQIYMQALGIEEAVESWNKPSAKSFVDEINKKLDREIIKGEPDLEQGD